VAAFKSAGGNMLIGTPVRLDDIMKRLGTALDTRKLEILVSPVLCNGRCCYDGAAAEITAAAARLLSGLLKLLLVTLLLLLLLPFCLGS
jgi:hypothetical protein